MMEKYRDNFLNGVSKLDAVTDSRGEITKIATDIVESNSQKAIRDILKRIANIIDDKQLSKDIKKVAQIVNHSLIEYIGYVRLQQICKNKSESENNEDLRSLSELLAELESLVGLNAVKEKVHDLIAFQKVQKLRRENNLHISKSTLHLAFTGNPGTGKTTVARIVGRIYKQLGLLSRGHFIEVSRTDLIAGYQGQTALKVKDVIDRAKGGVLFIDEAYSITENDHSDSYGRECLTELTKALKDYRDDLVVIVAGYTEPMEKFFESNPGLKSRFNTFIKFPDYDASELEDILLTICRDNDYILSDGLKAEIHNYFVSKIENKDDNFSNGRAARNLYDELVMNHARRVSQINSPSKSDLKQIIKIDFNSGKK